MTLIEVPVLLQFRDFWFGGGKPFKASQFTFSHYEKQYSFLKILKIKKSYDPSILLLGIYLKKMKTLT